MNRAATKQCTGKNMQLNCAYAVGMAVFAPVQLQWVRANNNSSSGRSNYNKQNIVHYIDLFWKAKSFFSRYLSDSSHFSLTLPPSFVSPVLSKQREREKKKLNAVTSCVTHFASYKSLQASMYQALCNAVFIIQIYMNNVVFATFSSQ